MVESDGPTLPNMNNILKSVIDNSANGGNLSSNLLRNNSKIRQDRALELTDDAKFDYRQMIINKARSIKKLLNGMRASIDLSPTSTQTLGPTKDFDTEQFAKDDSANAIAVRVIMQEVRVMRLRFAVLFGEMLSDAELDIPEEANIYVL
jgi:hypothetical protein